MFFHPEHYLLTTGMEQKAKNPGKGLLLGEREKSTISLGQRDIYRVWDYQGSQEAKFNDKRDTKEGHSVMFPLQDIC